MIDPKILAATQDFKETRDGYRADSPAVIEAFFSLKQAAMTQGPIDAVTKALIAVLLGVAHQSERCVLSHAEAAVLAGVSREQLIDGLGLTVVFGGAPGYGFATLALDTFDTFADKLQPA
ncbi:carboxymuconolactone decarboxylase family protein [Mycolicibacterium sp. CH28]|uniref:carboxymuconolactone decarboxylase family protein n=1 Tax=Mycolicibacterium sp. CH28 TaxID=2512237 RepID=UPI0010811BDD|nr:carboxymuconolactone decarboxylase family protein [Mycolicibacterium sp. CH28]TGD89993.1 carboxymuconolactone decarboxylase family protein [Mycolicibacterium sp. CH28]